MNRYDELTNEYQNLIDKLTNTLTSVINKERKKLGKAIEAAIEDTHKRENELIWIDLRDGTWDYADTLVVAIMRPSDDICEWSAESIKDFGLLYGGPIAQAATNE